MNRSSLRVLFAFVLLLLGLAFPAHANDVTVSGTVSFSSLDGGPDDEDHTVNGVFTVSGNLTINGTINCNDDSGSDSACAMRFNVGHDLIINAGGGVFAENRTGTGSGGAISFTVGNNFVMHGASGGLGAAIVSTDSTSSSGSAGGAITANVTGDVTIESGATIDSGSNNAAAGNISVTAGGHVVVGGNVLAGPDRTILSTRLTDTALNSGTANQIGGAITIKSTNFVEPGITVGSNANIISQGETNGSGPVTLEGCGVVVNGLVASLARKDATARVVIRSGRGIQVDGRDLGVTGATLGRNGRIRGDAPTGTAVNHLIDFFAFRDISILGPAPAASSLFVVTGLPGVNTSKSVGATIRIISTAGGVTGSGNFIDDGRMTSGDDGGNVSIAAQSDINLDQAVIISVGDSNTNNTNRGGGTIDVRSYSGNVVWTNGTGDVRPTGSGSGLPTSAQGAITVTACGSISFGGSSFPTNGSPVGPWPVTATACSPAAPSLPAGEPALPICCNVITVTNPSTSVATVGTPFSATFTQTGAIGAATFTVASGSLPSGLTLSSSGVLSGTPTQLGTFPITVEVTDSQGCTGIGPTYNLQVVCPTITVTNPSVTSTVIGTPFSVTFTESGGIGTTTFSESGALPSGLTFSSSGVLSGTPAQLGTFPITVTATDSFGCTGTGATYTLQVVCPTITVTNPSVNSGVAGTPFSATFTESGGIGTTTFSESGALPAGITLSPSGVLSGTPTTVGSFPITVTATDSFGCTGSSSYTLTIACQTISVTNPAANSGTAGSPFSVTFTQSGGIGTTTFSLVSGTLPAGVALSPSGVLAGTPTQVGTFTITVKATDANGCSGTGAPYSFTIVCQVITVTHPAVMSGTVGAPFSGQYTESGGIGTTTFSESGALPNGITFSASGLLSGTPTQVGTFPITATATDANGCTGTDSFTLTIVCQTITVTNPSTSTATVGTPFSQQFTQSGAIGTVTFTTASTLPAGLTLAADGTLSGTPTQSGTFPIVVTVTDANGCTGTSATYTLIVSCQTITVTNPSTNTGTVGSPFSVTFTQSGGIGTITWSESGTLPSGVTLDASTGVLSGTPTQPGTFPIVVTATDGNGCSGSGATYTLTIACQTITVTNPATNSGTVDAPFSATFTESGAIGTATFTVNSGSLPAGLSLSSTGILSGTPQVPGTFTITVKVTDANGCTGIGATYTLTIACQTITVTNPAANSAIYNTPFSATFTQSGVGTHTPATFSIASGALPAGLTLSSAGVLSGSPTQTGVFTITVKVTDANGCSGTGPAYTLSVAPKLTAKSYSTVGNTQLDGGGPVPSTPTVVSVAVSNGDSSDAAITYALVASPAHGTLAFNPDGTFLYTPNVANASSDAFMYSGTSNGVTATQTATINFSGRVWYVHAGGAAGDGRSNTPFNTLASAGSPTSFGGDFIYVEKEVSGTTPGSIALQAAQSLIGAGATLSVPTATPLLTVAGSAANTPTLTGTVTLSDTVTVAGVDMNVSGIRAITNFNGSYTAVSGITVNVRNVTGTTGPVIDLGSTGNSGSMTFQSVSATGGSNGIFVQSLGAAGSFTVTGNGGICTSGSPATCSGGVIANAAGADGTTAGTGIYLANVGFVSLNFMYVHDAQNYGIFGTSIGSNAALTNTLALDHVIVSGTNGTLVGGVNPEGSVEFIGVSGKGSVTNSYFAGGANDNFHLENNGSQSLNRIVFTSDTFDDTQATGASDLFLQADCTSTLNATITGCTFNAARANNLNLSIRGTSSDDFIVQNNTFNNTSPNQVSGASNVSISSGSGGACGTYNPAVTFNISNNTFQGARGTAVSVSKGGSGPGSFGTASQHAVIDSNTIGVSGNSTSAGAGGIAVALVGGGSITTDITNNVINGAITGITLLANSSVAGGGQGYLTAVVQGNSVATPNVGSGNLTNGILAQFGSVSTDNPKVCLTLGGSTIAQKNSLSGAGQNGGFDLRLRVRFGTLIGVVGYVGANNDDTAMNAFLTSNNVLTTVNATNNALTGSGWTGTCP